MDEKCKAILAGLAGKKNCSQLTPHHDLIYKLHQRGCTFREIARILTDNFNLTVAHSTVLRFLARLEQEESKPRKTKPRKEKPVPVMTTAPVKPAPDRTMPPSDEVRQRIEALKQRQAHFESEIKSFDYDPDQPLHLVHDNYDNKDFGKVNK